MEGVSTDVDAIVTELARTGEVGRCGRKEIRKERKRGPSEIDGGWMGGWSGDGGKRKERGEERREYEKAESFFLVDRCFFAQLVRDVCFAEHTTKKAGQDGKDGWVEGMQ